MFALGRTDDASSSVPTRTTVKPGRPVESANSCEPHCPQKRRVTWFPLSEVFTYWLTVPVTSMAELGTKAFTVPFDEIR